MSDGQMTYEDWLRGCVHHDGRHGYVTLPCEEVLKIADFIERLRAEQTEPQSDDKHAVCTGCDYYDLPNAFHPCASCVDFSKYKPQTERSSE